MVIYGRSKRPQTRYDRTSHTTKLCYRTAVAPMSGYRAPSSSVSHHRVLSDVPRFGDVICHMTATCQESLSDRFRSSWRCQLMRKAFRNTTSRGGTGQTMFGSIH